MRLKNLTALALLTLSTLSARCVVHADQNPAYNGIPGSNAYGDHGVTGTGSTGHRAEGFYDGGKGGNGGDGYRAYAGSGGKGGDSDFKKLSPGNGGAGGNIDKKFYIGKDR